MYLTYSECDILLDLNSTIEVRLFFTWRFSVQPDPPFITSQNIVQFIRLISLLTLDWAGDPVRADLGDQGGANPRLLSLGRDLLREPTQVSVPLPSLQILQITPEFLF